MTSASFRPRVSRLIVAIAAAGLVLSACGSGSEQTNGAAAAASPAPGAGIGGASGAPGAVTVPQPLKFTAATVSGGTIEGATLLSSPTVAWFWAPWCSICRAEAPDVAAAQAKFSGQVTFVGIAGRGPVRDMQQFIADTGVGSFEHAVDPDGRIWTGFRVLSQPAFAFIHPDGSIEMVNGSLSSASLEERIGGLLDA